MQQESLNKQLKEIYAPQYSEDIPSAFLEDLEKRLDQQQAKKKSGVLWWSGGVLGLLLSVFSGWYFYSTTPENFRVKIPSKMGREKRKEIKNTNQIDFKTSSERSAKTEPTLELNPLTFHPNTKEVEPKNGLVSGVFDNDILLVSMDSPAPQISEFPTKSKAIESEEEDKEWEVTKNAEIQDSSITASPVQVENTTPTLIQKDKRIKNWKLETGFGMGLSTVFSSFTTQNEAIFQAVAVLPETYRTTRQKEERAISSIDFNLYQFIYWKKLVFGSGFSMFQMGEQIRYTEAEIFGENRYNYFSVPVYFGYQWNIKSFSLQPMLGAHFAWSRTEEGRYLSPNMNEVSIISNQSFTSLLSAQVRLSYHSASGFGVQLSPYFRQTLVSPIQGAFTQNHYRHLGIETGIFYQFK
jgi:hypothetical protein